MKLSKFRFLVSLEALACLVVLSFIQLTANAGPLVKDHPKARAGIGLGIPYSFAGVKLEGHLNDHVSPFLAFGTGAPQEPAEFAFGAHIYCFDPGSSFRPRLTFVNGLNRIIEHDRIDENPEYTGVRGNSAGFGFSFGKDFGVDVDLLYILSQTKEGDANSDPSVFSEYETQKTPKVTLALGFHWAIK